MTGAEWDARTLLEIGLLIDRYLRERPPPSDSKFARSFEDWGDKLRAAGQEDLDGLAARRLVPVA